MLSFFKNKGNEATTHLKQMIESEFPYTPDTQDNYECFISDSDDFPLVIKKHIETSKNQTKWLPIISKKYAAIFIGESHFFYTLLLQKEQFLFFIDIDKAPKQSILFQMKILKNALNYQDFINQIETEYQKDEGKKYLHLYNLTESEFNIAKNALKDKVIIFTNLDLKNQEKVDQFFKIIKEHGVIISFFNFSNVLMDYYLGITPQTIQLIGNLPENCAFHISTGAGHGSAYFNGKEAFLTYLTNVNVTGSEPCIFENTQIENATVFFGNKQKRFEDLSKRHIEFLMKTHNKTEAQLKEIYQQSATTAAQFKK